MGIEELDEKLKSEARKNLLYLRFKTNRDYSHAAEMAEIMIDNLSEILKNNEQLLREADRENKDKSLSLLAKILGIYSTGANALSFNKTGYFKEKLDKLGRKIEDIYPGTKIEIK